MKELCALCDNESRQGLLLCDVCAEKYYPLEITVKDLRKLESIKQRKIAEHELRTAVENFKAELLKAFEPFCIPIIEWLRRVIESRQKVTCLTCGYPFRGRRCTRCGGEWVGKG